MTKPLIRIENLTKSFTKDSSIFKNLNLSLPKGEMIGVVGPDGAGKTTLLRLVASLLTPTSGRIEVMGHNTVSDAEKILASSGYMPQRFGLYEDLSVIQNLELYASLKGLAKTDRKDVFEKLLEFTGLKPFQSRLAAALSGGMKQKLGLACTLIRKPELLILDEPTVGVDPISRRELWEMVASLLKEEVSVLWSTAYLNEAEKCGRIVLLKDGEVLYEGPPQELTRRVEGRVFSIEDASSEKRKRLSEIENSEDVIDALIAGSQIRVVAKSGSFPLGKKVEPRLEDAFIDLLGGKAKGESKLSRFAPESPRDGKESAVIAENLVKRFGSFTAVDGTSFSIQKGEIFGLLGPNGAGKSTTFKMLCGLLKPTEGKAEVNGLSLDKAPNLARSKIGYMAQKLSLYNNLTVLQNLKFFAGIYSAEKNLDQALDIFDLQKFQNNSAELLPIGIKQRLALAASTLHWPELLFLDEPTSGMDPVSRRKFWSQMNDLARKGKTLLVSTHFMDEAENCDRIGIIYRGKVIHLDTPDRVKELARSEEKPHPTLEDAFIHLIEVFDGKEG